MTIYAMQQGMRKLAVYIKDMQQMWTTAMPQTAFSDQAVYAILKKVT